MNGNSYYEIDYDYEQLRTLIPRTIIRIFYEIENMGTTLPSNISSAFSEVKGTFKLKDLINPYILANPDASEKTAYKVMSRRVRELVSEDFIKLVGVDGKSKLFIKLDTFKDIKIVRPVFRKANRKKRKTVRSTQESTMQKAHNIDFEPAIHERLAGLQIDLDMNMAKIEEFRELMNMFPTQQEYFKNKLQTSKELSIKLSGRVEALQESVQELTSMTQQ